MIHTTIGQAAAPAILYDGATLTLDDLPPRYNRRWPAALQMRLLAAIDGGLLTEAEACARYALKPTELGAWRPTAVEPESAAMRRLVATLVQRGYLSEGDAAYVNDPHASRLDAPFPYDDAPFDFG